MVHLIIEVSKYLMIVLLAIYTYQCFAVFRRRSPERQNRIFNSQASLIYLIHLDAFLVIYASTLDLKVIGLYLVQLILLVIIQLCYKVFYRKASRLVVNNMCMLLAIGFIILTRLDFDKAMKQCEIAVSTVYYPQIEVFSQIDLGLRRSRTCTLKRSCGTRCKELWSKIILFLWRDQYPAIGIYQNSLCILCSLDVL